MGMLNLDNVSQASAPGGYDRTSRRFVLASLARFPHGCLHLVEPDGNRITIGEGAPEAALEMHDWRTYRMMFTGGGLGAAEAYMENLWSSQDLTAVVRFFAANVEHMQALEKGMARVVRPLRAWFHALNRNSLRGSRRNISAHYDLGNDFFSLFLDSQMMYSSAVFESESESLEKASERKLDLLCQKLDLKPEHHLLEIGTGWGGMAIWAARHYGCRVTTTTISREQYEFARARVEQEGLADRVTVLDQDYRELTGQYDRLVSVEMIEAVGHQYLPEYFSRLGSLLKPDGRMVLQAITVPEQRYRFALKNVDFIKRYIFPGGFLPSVEVMLGQLSRQTRLVVQDIEDIGHDYALTLRAWRERFLGASDAVASQGFDGRFRRTWDYYLAYCEGAFLERAISTVQLVAAGPAWRP